MSWTYTTIHLNPADSIEAKIEGPADGFQVFVLCLDDHRIVTRHPDVVRRIAAACMSMVPAQAASPEVAA